MAGELSRKVFHKKLDVMERRLPPPDPKWESVPAVVSAGKSVLHAPPPLTLSAVSRLRSEVFGRLRPAQLLHMLQRANQLSPGVEGGVGGGDGAAPGELRIVSVAAGASGAQAGEGGKPEVIVLDVRSGEKAEEFAAVHLVSALHAPFATYMYRDLLPPALHAARRQVPQPVVVVTDDGAGRELDGPEFATKLVQCGGFNAVMVLDGALRAAALEAPALVGGERGAVYVAGVEAEVAQLRGRGKPRGRRERGSGAEPGGGGAAAEPGGGGGGGSPGRGGSVAGSARSTHSVSTFGASKRF
jgi:hypothetical protein